MGIGCFWKMCGEKFSIKAPSEELISHQGTQCRYLLGLETDNCKRGRNYYNFIKIDPPSSIPDLQLFSADFPGNTITSSLFLAPIISLSKILCNPKQHYAYNSLKKGRKNDGEKFAIGSNALFSSGLEIFLITFLTMKFFHTVLSSSISVPN